MVCEDGRCSVDVACGLWQVACGGGRWSVEVAGGLWRW